MKQQVLIKRQPITGKQKYPIIMNVIYLTQMKQGCFLEFYLIKHVVEVEFQNNQLYFCIPTY